MYAVQASWSSGPIGLRTRVNIRSRSCKSYFLASPRPPLPLWACHTVSEEAQRLDFCPGTLGKGHERRF